MRIDRSPRWILLPVAATALLVGGLAACGGDGGDGGDDGAPALPPAAVAGRDLARSQGCASCHGDNGQGGVGPAWTGLAGSEVELSDGSTVIADEAYLTRAITDPNAEMVDGYTLQMPTNSLTADEVASIVEYITALGGADDPGGSTAATTADS